MPIHPFDNLALQTQALGQTTHYFETIDSTNRWLRDKVSEMPHGTVVFAGHQSAGRGRLGRRWVTPPGTALLHSILLKPDWPIEQSGWIVMIAGLAIVRGIHTVYGLEAQLKWPNDIVVHQDGELYKVGGILVDTQLSRDRLVDAVVGIGINVNISAQALPTTNHLPAGSLLSLTGKTYPLTRLAEAGLTHLESLYMHCHAGNSPREAYKRALITLDQAVSVTFTDDDHQAKEGKAVDVDEWGRLMVQFTEGEPTAIAAGDVTLRPSFSNS